MKATTAGWTPPWYSQYRFYLSILVGVCILGTLFGVNYLGPTTDIALAQHLTETGVLGSSLGFIEHNVRGEIEDAKRAQKQRYAPANAQFWTEEGEDGFVRIVKKQEEDEEKEGEGEGEEGAEKSDDDEGEKSEEGDKSDDGDGAKKDDTKDSSDSKDDSTKSDQDQPKSDDADDQKNPRAGKTGENMDSAKQDKEELMQKRDGASKAK